MCLHVSRVFGCSFPVWGLFDGLSLFFVPFQSRAREKKKKRGVTQQYMKVYLSCTFASIRRCSAFQTVVYLIFKFFVYFSLVFRVFFTVATDSANRSHAFIYIRNRNVISTTARTTLECKALEQRWWDSLALGTPSSRDQGDRSERDN